MRVAIVGFGSIGRRHAQNLGALGIDVVLVRTAGVGNDLGIPEVRAIDRLQADAVVVCTPTAVHAEVIGPLLAQGVPVLCEKPLVATPEQADQLAPLIAAAQAPGRVALNMRWHPTVRTAREWLAQGRIGVLKYARLSVGQYLPDWRPNRDPAATYSAVTSLGGGVRLDLIHELDLAFVFAGGCVGEPAGMAARVSDLTVDSEDVAELVYLTDSGALVSVHMDYLHRGYHRECWLVGTEGSMRADLAGARLEWFGADGRLAASEAPFAFERNDMYRAVVRDFLEEVRGGKGPFLLPTFEEHLATLRTAWRIRRVA